MRKLLFLLKKCVTYCSLSLSLWSMRGLLVWHFHHIERAAMCFQSAGDVDPADGTYMLPFETMHQEENINKCLPPSTFKSPLCPARRTPTPRSPEKPQPHMWHITRGGRKHVFGIKPLRALSNKIHFLICSFHNIYILRFFFFLFFPSPGGVGFAPCQLEVSRGGKVYKKQAGGTEPHWEKKSGRVDIRSKTNSLTSKPWQTLLTGLLVSQLSSQMPFKPFILFFTGTRVFSSSLHRFWGVCVVH